MSGDTDELREEAWSKVAGYLDEHGFLSWLDISVAAIERGHVTFEMPYDEKLVNPSSGSDGTIHGGVAATLVDTASGFALRTTFENPAEARLTTTDLDVKYLRPARDDLTVEADVVRAGGSVGVTDVTVSSNAPDGDCKAVAVGSTSYRLFREGSS